MMKMMITIISKVSESTVTKDDLQKQGRERTMNCKSDNARDSHLLDHFLEEANKKTYIRYYSTRHAKPKHDSEIQRVGLEFDNLVLRIGSDIPVIRKSRYR